MSSLKALLEVALTQPERLSEYLEGLTLLSPELAAEAVRAASAAISVNDLGRAEAAFLVAMMISARIGDWPRVVYCGIHHAEVIKGSAETEERHELARESARAMMGLARRLGLADLMFQASAVAADSAYFAAQACKEAPNFIGYLRWLLVTVEDCAEALELMEAAPDSGRARNLISLVTATVQQATGQVRQIWLTEDDEKDRLDRALRRIALAVEALVPPGAETFDAPREQRNVSLILSRLSYTRGSPDIGRARLMHLAESTELSGDIAGFMHAVADMYRGERSSCRTSADLATLRLRFTGAVDKFRLLSRSRAGRLWSAQQLDEMSGEMVSDEFSRLVGRDVGRAYRALEMMKARTLLDEITGLTRELPDPGLKARAAELEAQILRLDASPSLDTVVGDQARLVSRLPVAGLSPSPGHERALAQLEEIYARHDGGFISTAPVGELAAIIRTLGPREAIISYHIPYDPGDPGGTLLILLITPQGALPIHLPILRGADTQGITGRMQADGQQPMDTSQLGDLILGARMSILQARDETAIACLAELHRVLVNPLVEAGFDIAGYDTLYVVPHGSLHGVPFMALRTPEGRFLAEDVATVVAPSVSVWEVLRRREAKRPVSFLGFANPVLDGGYEPLPETETELDAVTSYLTGCDMRVYSGTDASEAALRQDLPGRSIVHFATHGEFPEADVMNLHRILLSPSGEHDGHITAEELRRMDFGAAELVVLSICNGGVYRFGPGDEPYGLLSALLAAGARNIVGPAWPIDDFQGRLLITEFYQQLAARGPAEALRRATVARMHAGAEIRDWAGFTLFGAGMWSIAEPMIAAHPPT